MVASQQNAWIHAAATVVVGVAGVILRLSWAEWCWIVLAVTTVWTAEALIDRPELKKLPLTLLTGNSHQAIAACDAALAASGTATLETALYRKPMVITYRMANSTWAMMSRMRYQPWVGLPNIIEGAFLVPELLQEQATPENLSAALLNVALDPVIQSRLPLRFARIHEQLRRDASERAADALVPWLNAH